LRTHLVHYKTKKKRSEMAGNMAALRNYFDATLQVPVTVREAVITQGMSSFEDFLGLSDKDIKDICDSAKRPGGMGCVLLPHLTKK
jgi:hypothetical protein